MTERGKLGNFSNLMVKFRNHLCLWHKYWFKMKKNINYSSFPSECQNEEKHHQLLEHKLPYGTEEGGVVCNLR